MHVGVSLLGDWGNQDILSLGKMLLPLLLVDMEEGKEGVRDLFLANLNKTFEKIAGRAEMAASAANALIVHPISLSQAIYTDPCGWHILLCVCVCTCACGCRSH